MPIAFWGSALALALAGCASGGAAPVAPESANIGVGNGANISPERSELEVRTPSGVSHRVHVELDDAVAPGASPIDVRVIAENDRLLVIVDTYASRSGGMSYCRAGEESFLRVLSLTTGTPLETMRLKVSSCRYNIELGSPGIVWDASRSTLHVAWLSGPASPSSPAELTFHIGGQVRRATPSN